MDDFSNFDKNIVRELSCRLCLCTDVVKLKPLNAEVKRKMKKLFGIIVRSDDTLPKAICHDCLQQIASMHLYTVKVEKTQKFLEYRTLKTGKDVKESDTIEKTPHIATTIATALMVASTKSNLEQKKSPKREHHQGDIKETKSNICSKKKSITSMRYLEEMPVDEFIKTEKIDKAYFSASPSIEKKKNLIKKNTHLSKQEKDNELSTDSLDPVVLIDGRPAKEGVALDRQITLFYKMECCICHETGFHFRSLMKHYKDKHGVPGYVTCCDKKFHYFHPKKIIEHMAYHLQTNIFMCESCHQNFQSSQELHEHQSNGGRSEGKILCPRCSERYPTYRELGCHLTTHRNDKLQCDYCAKLLKHNHRKKTVNHMEDLILCSQCIRTLKNIEKQDKEVKDRLKSGSRHTAARNKRQKFRQAMGLSPDDESSTE